MPMDVSEFRDAVHAHFGERLERATPASVREFMGRVRLNLGVTPEEPLAETEDRYTSEEMVRHFFAHVFDFPTATGFILLWIAAFEPWFAATQPDPQSAFARLMREIE